MTFKPNWNIIAWVVVAVLVTYIITSKTTRSDDKVWQNEIKHLEEDKKELQIENADLKEERLQLITDSRYKDSIFTTQSNKIEVRYKNIPVIVRALPDDELARAIERLPND